VEGGVEREHGSLTEEEEKERKKERKKQQRFQDNNS